MKSQAMAEGTPKRAETRPVYEERSPPVALVSDRMERDLSATIFPSPEAQW